jgi:predicted short-subunit dehydrogenase-like oxidoreductase (DUF2520 family)
MLARSLGSKTFVIDKSDKLLYHAAGVFASNYIVTLLSIARAVAKKAHIPERISLAIFENITSKTVANVFSYGPRKALTGPIARRDFATVREHIKALKRSGLKKLVPTYTLLAKETNLLART